MDDSGRQWLPPTRILLIDMPRMLREIIRDVAAQDPTITIVGEVDGTPDLVTSVAPFDADVVVASVAVSDPSSIVLLLDAHPRTRVLTIGDDGGQSVLYRLSPEAIFLGDVSPARLLEAMQR